MNDWAWGPRIEDGLGRFRLWAPSQERLVLRLDGTDHPMTRSDDAWFEVQVPAEAGMDYGFVLESGQVVPDPAARAQAGDVHGLSRLVAPSFDWRHDWTGRPGPRPW